MQGPSILFITDRMRCIRKKWEEAYVSDFGCSLYSPLSMLLVRCALYSIYANPALEQEVSRSIGSHLHPGHALASHIINMPATKVLTLPKYS
jgi:hypothetical protein